LRLLAERNRISTAFDIATRDRLFGYAWQGRVALDAGLRWEVADNSLRLQQVRVGELSLETVLSLPRREQAERLAALLGERLLEGMSIYRLSPERAARLQRLGVRPGAITVTPRGIDIALVPAG
jgi:hypothetical protein